MLEGYKEGKRKFEIRWFDLNKVAQRRLLSCIFGDKPIIAEVEFEHNEDEIVYEMYSDGECVCTEKEEGNG